ncbi:MAG: hypothetical protein ACNI3C_00445 [Candidatus Marinarcus sp.]|uniref:hypothetical protein n=1 Tax=Candidatus Marinarcus sp. TaxID=3100987 RepID=UPI003B001C58
MKKIKFYLFESLYKSVIATIFFIIVYQFSYIEIIRSNIEDISFDLLNKFTIENRVQETTSPNVLLFKIDDYFLKEKKLLDDNNTTTYGYLFPRDNIAAFIEKLDDFIIEFDKNQKPHSLFIDYDFSYTSLPYNNELSKEDQNLIDTLKKDRDYKIFLPKTNNFNFIEQSTDIKIQQLIKEKKLNFVSVGLIESSDGVSRRYLPYRDFLNNNQMQSYTQAMLTLWNDFKNNTQDNTKLQNTFTNKNDIENRIIFKSYAQKIDEGEFETYISNWKKFYVYSANYPFDEIIEDNFYGSIILLGGTHSNNDDVFNIASMKNSDVLSGIEVQANVLMTLFYLNGKLEKFDFYKSCMIIFSAFLIINLVVELIFDLLNLQERRSLEFIVLLIILSAVLFFISYYIFNTYKQWFNWFIPVILFETIEILETIKKYSKDSYTKIKNRRNK